MRSTADITGVEYKARDLKKESLRATETNWYSKIQDSTKSIETKQPIIGMTSPSPIKPMVEKEAGAKNVAK